MKHPQTDRKPGRPRRDDAPNLRTAMLEAAIDLFGERGFDGVSLSQIAGKAGADIGLTRYYFGSKGDLWEAAMAHLAVQFARAVEETTETGGGSKSDQLKSVVRAFVYASARWPQMSRIIVFDGDKSDERGAFIATRLVGPFFKTLSRLIAGAKAEGTIPNVSDRTIFFMITHGGSFPMALPVLTNALPGGNIKSARALRAHADAIIALIFQPTSTL